MSPSLFWVTMRDPWRLKEISDAKNLPQYQDSCDPKAESLHPYKQWTDVSSKTNTNRLG